MQAVAWHLVSPLFISHGWLISVSTSPHDASPPHDSQQRRRQPSHSRKVSTAVRVSNEHHVIRKCFQSQPGGLRQWSQPPPHPGCATDQRSDLFAKVGCPRAGGTCEVLRVIGLSRGSANPEPSKKNFEIDVCANAWAWFYAYVKVWS